MKKQSIPEPTANQADFNRAVKVDLEIIMGQRGGRISALSAAATTAEVIAKVNEIIATMQK